jgi:hypothetical protein
VTASKDRKKGTEGTLKGGDLPEGMVQALVLMERLHKKFWNSEDKGEKSFSALQALSMMFMAGTVLNPDFPRDPDKQESFMIPAPLWALQHVVNSLKDYMAAEHGRTLGEVLGLEGGGQGRQKLKDRLKKRMVHRELALYVEVLRQRLKEAGKREEAKLVNVYEVVAERSGFSADSVAKAHTMYRIKLSRAAAGPKE